MKLNDINQFIKDNLNNIINGKFNDKFEKEELTQLLKLSFLLNHIELENSHTILFEYNESKIRMSNLDELNIPGVSLEDTILQQLMEQSEFLNAFKTFIRDVNIDKICSE